MHSHSFRLVVVLVLILVSEEGELVDILLSGVLNQNPCVFCRFLALEVRNVGAVFVEEGEEGLTAIVVGQTDAFVVVHVELHGVEVQIWRLILLVVVFDLLGVFLLTFCCCQRIGKEKKEEEIGRLCQASPLMCHHVEFLEHTVSSAGSACGTEMLIRLYFPTECDFVHDKTGIPNWDILRVFLLFSFCCHRIGKEEETGPYFKASPLLCNYAENLEHIVSSTGWMKIDTLNRSVDKAGFPYANSC